MQALFECFGEAFRLLVVQDHFARTLLVLERAALFDLVDRWCDRMRSGLWWGFRTGCQSPQYSCHQ